MSAASNTTHCPSRSKMAEFNDEGKVGRLTMGNTQFAISLYKKLAASNQGNVFFSPLSISNALSMVMLGARGNTAKEMMQGLCHNEIEDESSVHEAFQDYNGVLNKADASYKLLCANKLYCRQDYSILEEFLAQTLKYYSAQAETADFAGDSTGCREKINSWVAQQTADKIQELLPEGTPDPMTAMVLVNAIYFKGDWADKFDSHKTTKRSFIINSTTTDDNVEFMYKSDKFNMVRLPRIRSRAVEIPYKGDDLSFVIVLPDAKDGFSELEKNITALEVNSMCRSMKKVDMDLCFPKFKLNFSAALKETMSSLGMKEVFVAGKADLSGVDGGKQLYMSEVYHKSFIEVNEEGTEAAAATATMIMLCSMPPPKEEFFCNHPFLYFIRDKRNNGVLFMGSFKEPPRE